MGTPDDEIRGYVRRFAEPTPASFNVFLSRGRRALLARGEFLTRLGDDTTRLAFVHSGAVRYHVIMPDTGADVTKDFSFAPTFALSFGSAIRRQPARVAVSAVLDCVVTLWPGDIFDESFAEDIEWERFRRKVAEWLYVRKEDREMSFLLQSSEERYISMLAEFPSDAGRLPQHLLASYLGIAPESLSRIKARRPA